MTGEFMVVAPGTQQYFPSASYGALEFLLRHVDSPQGFVFDEWEMGPQAKTRRQKKAMLTQLLDLGVLAALELRC
jgi:hypothetical protein